ncbi:MAG: peptidoglycan DD-metalloendopeptidase family protein [Gammaproteobacteria bacterium]|nr:peptidoglycan DD-metalloendopeptidase family protein [Gammaproteobacteria bacterium]MYD79339.1 peptidoglycan DD-metalloendopeptidase family protein [Gammaproteobacteria bacterium]
MHKLPIKHLFTCSLLIAGLIGCVVLFTDRPAALNVEEVFTFDDEFSSSSTARDTVDTYFENSPLMEGLANRLDAIDTQRDTFAQETTSVTIKNGDTLSAIFDRLDIDRADLTAIQEASPRYWKSLSLRAGRNLEYRLDDSGSLEYFEYSPEDLVDYSFTRTGDAMTFESRTRKVVSNETYRWVTIQRGDSVISAGLAAGIRQEKTLWRIPKLLQWDIDFYHDIHPGDSFQILYYERFVDGEYYEDGEIIALQFTSGNRPYNLVRYEDEGIFKGYFTREGYAARKRFLRTPVEYTRISDGFNLKRLHPIHKVVKPHLGIDYAAPTGTPVYATGDGVVSKFGYTSANGNYVFLEHDRVYKTKYLHLFKIDPAIKKGATVKQGQRIGSVGMTGHATGPHLHYEFLVNGEHQDPATIHLPEGKPLSEDEIERFQAHADELFDRMNALRSEYPEARPSLVNR